VFSHKVRTEKNRWTRTLGQPPARARHFEDRGDDGTGQSSQDQQPSQDQGSQGTQDQQPSQDQSSRDQPSQDPSQDQSQDQSAIRRRRRVQKPSGWRRLYDRVTSWLAE